MVSFSALLAFASVALSSAAFNPVRANRATRSARLGSAQAQAPKFVDVDIKMSLEDAAEAYGLHVVRGQLHAFSEAEVLEADRVLARNWPFPQGWDPIKGASKKIAKIADLAATFPGGATVVGAMSAGFTQLQISAEEAVKAQQFVASTLENIGEQISATVAGSPSASSDFLLQVSAFITSNAAVNTLSKFCNVVLCVTSPSYDNCAPIPPFKGIVESIESAPKPVGMKEKVKIYAQKAAVSALMMLLGQLVSAGRMALHSVPGGGKVDQLLDALSGKCELIIAGNGNTAENNPATKYGARCFLGELAKFADGLRVIIDTFRKPTFSEMPAYFTEKFPAFPDFGNGNLVTCIVEKASACPGAAAAKP